MAEKIKKLLAWAALACMVVFVGSIVVLTVSGKLQEQFAWVGVSLALFLLFAAGSLAIRWAQEKKKEKAEAAAKAENGEEQA